jgi:hypothetical protein
MVYVGQVTERYSVTLYRMYFVGEGVADPIHNGPDIQFAEDSLEHARQTVETMLADLPLDDPAVAFCLVDAGAGRIVHSGLCPRTLLSGAKLGAAASRPRSCRSTRAAEPHSGSTLLWALFEDERDRQSSSSGRFALEPLRRFARRFAASRPLPQSV